MVSIARYLIEGGGIELGYTQMGTYISDEWARQDSNLRPDGYEPPALPLSYEPLERETRLELATTCLEGRDSTN